jgi:hypothetical protein
MVGDEALDLRTGVIAEERDEHAIEALRVEVARNKERAAFGV